MSNKEVIDWVRSEKAEGLSDTQLKVALIKKGYSGKDVDKLVDITHKKKINWAPFITLFIISMVLFFVMGFISKINNAVVIFSFGLVLALIYSEIIHHNSNQKEPFIELFIVNFFSMVFSLSLAILFFNLLVFLLYITKTKVIFPLLILIPSICIIILIYVFYFTVAFVSKRFVGYFDSESYFIFKHWPIKILNVDWNRKWTLLKYPLIIILGCLFISAIIFYLYLGVVGNTMGFLLPDEGTTLFSFNEEQSNLEIVQELQKQKEDVLLQPNKKVQKPNIFNALNVMNKHSISRLKYYRQLSLQKKKNEIINYFSSEPKTLSKNNEKILLFDDFERGLGTHWSSQNKTYNSEGGFWHIEEETDGNQVMEGWEHIWVYSGSENWKINRFETKFKILDGETHINFIHRNYPVDGRYYILIEEGYIGLYRQYKNWTTFEKLEPVNVDIKKGVWYDLKIEINNSNTYPIIVSIDDKVVIKSTHLPIYDSGKISFETLDNSIIWFDDVTVINYDDKLNSYLQNHYNVFKKNKEELNAHIFKINSNIEILYPRYLETRSNIYADECKEEYSFWNIFSFFGSVDYFYDTLYFQRILCEGLFDVREYNEQLFENFYQTRNVEESLQSKVIRLKIIETLLATVVADSCNYYLAETWQDYENYKISCYTNIAELTGTPSLFLNERDLEYVS